MDRRGFLRSMAALVTTAAIDPAVLLKFPPLPRVRKLRAVWTIKSANDLRALHGADVEKELIACLIKDIAANCDRHWLGLD